MAILKVMTFPDAVLKMTAAEVESVDDGVRTIMNDMLETMYSGNGAGLAANQVGILKRIVVFDLGEDDETEREKGFYPLFMANPVITYRSPEMVEAKEGCLSVIDQRIPVIRHSTIEVQYLDYHNKPQTLRTDGWLARGVQHEVDHLNGTLIIDYLSKLKKDIVVRKLMKLRKKLSP